MPNFETKSTVESDVTDLYKYHANPGAINRLIPPWENISIEQRSDSLVVGSEVVIRNALFGIPVTWHAKHTQLNPPNSFQDIQLSGPFKTWIHDHHFQSVGVGLSTLEDRIYFETKFGWLGTLGWPIVRRKLDAMFAYRHRTTSADLRLQSFLRPFISERSLRIGVTGSSGMIGRRLVDLISVLGHSAVRILRPTSNDRPQDFPLSSVAVVWQPGQGFSGNGSMENLDAVIHLAGKGIADGRWTEAAKQSIRDSRIEGTRMLVADLCNLASPPRAFISASGVGIYGDRNSDTLDEFEPPGTDFLAKLAVDWESAALGFEQSGNRVAIGRLGIAIHPQQGALSKLLLPFKLGFGGPVGSGRQYWSWIDIDDAAAGFLYLAANPNAVGAYNFVAPEQTDNRSFSKTLGHVLGRPSLLPAPAFALRILLGEMADAMLLASTRANCRRLVDDGFPFRSPTLEACLKHVLGYESTTLK